MKAIILSHENGGTYCIDSTGSFHFVKGYESMDIGTEITIRKRKPDYVRRFVFLAVGLAAFCAIFVIMCCKPVSTGLQNPDIYEGGEVSYARFCAYRLEYCIKVWPVCRECD